MPASSFYIARGVRLAKVSLSAFFLLCGTTFAAPAPATLTDPDVQAVLSRAPLRFEAAPNDNNRWIGRSLGFTVAVTNHGASFGLDSRALKLTFADARETTKFTGEQKSAAPTNYFGKSFRSADAFLRLRQTGVYPGIDVVYYGQGQTLEYDFELAPNSDPSVIRMRFEGADAIRIAQDGSLILTMDGREITQRPPITYQRLTVGHVAAVSSEYVPESDGSYSIRLGVYDATRPLVIDPQVVYTAYLAGTGSDGPIGIKRDNHGYIYIAGFTLSDDFPQNGQTYPVFLNQPFEHIFVTKMNPFGVGDDVIPYTGFFDGQFGDMLKTFTVDGEGVFYLAGVTDDFYFPTTPSGYLLDNGQVRKMFFSVLDPKLPGASGLTYSTFFGSAANTDSTPSGIEEPTAITVAGTHVYLTGFTSSDLLPVKDFIYEKRSGANDGWIAEFDFSQNGASSLVHSTYLGGYSNDTPQSIAVDTAGKIYVAGNTGSSDFPTTVGSLKPFYSNATDAFVSKLDLNAKTLEYSTYVGGSGIDQAQNILVTPQGLVALSGFTLSPDFRVTPNAMQIKAGGDGDAFLMLLNLNAPQFTDVVLYSTLYGGSGADYPYDMRVGPSGVFYLCGYTLSRDLPVRDAIRNTSAGGSTDGFVAIIDPQATFANALVYSSYISGPGYNIPRGIDIDNAGNVYVTGAALGNVFQPGEASPPAASNTNVYILIFKPSASAVVRQDAVAPPADARSRRR